MTKREPLRRTSGSWGEATGALCAALAVLMATSTPLVNARLADPVDAYLPTSPASQQFPYASVVNFGSRHEPTGRHGFLRTTEDGRFAFDDGTPARFFGVNVAKDALFVDDETMDRMIERLRASGINLVRLHHFDGLDGILSGARDELDLFTASSLRRIDRWIAHLGAAGIYVYLDLLDYRTFGEADGIVGGERLGRGAKPYVVFDPRLRGLTKEYARKLLSEHVNPYTRLAYVEDPTVAFVEIYDENGLFIRRNDVPSLLSPYRQNMGHLWNEWLRTQYGSTETLRRAWTDPQTGECPLLERESLERGNLDLPRLVLRPANEPMPNADLTGAARMNDATCFFQAIQADFLSDMHSHLRSIGVRVPIGAVGSLDQPPDHAVMADTLDFIGTNFYWDHPTFTPGAEWQPPYWFANEAPLRSTGAQSIGPAVAAARVAGAPLVIREWSYCWPNEYRSLGMVEMAAFAAHQGIDCVLAFTYGAADAPPVGYFDLHRDSARWGVLAHAAHLYLAGGLQPASTRVRVVHSEVDLHSYYEYGGPLLALSYVTCVERSYGSTAVQAPATLNIASGRSASNALLGTNRLLWHEVRREDLRGTLSTSGPTERSGYNVARIIPEDPPTVTYTGFLHDSGTKTPWPARRLYVAEDLVAKRFQPIGLTADGKAALGFHDPSTRTWAFGQMPQTMAARAALDALGALGTGHIGHGMLDSGRAVTDTGQIIRDAGKGLMTVRGTTAVAVASCGTRPAPVTVGPLGVTSPSLAFAVIAVSLDGLPIEQSQSVSIRYVTDCRNTNQALRREAGGPKPFLLAVEGEAPPTSGFRTTGSHTEITWGGSPLVRLNAEGGEFELIVRPTEVVLIAEAPGIEVFDAAGKGYQLPLALGALRLAR